MTKKDSPPKELSKVARDYFGFKSLVGAMGAATLLPYFIPISLPAVVAWLLFCKRSLARYGKRGIVLYYLAPTFALIGAGLAFLGAEWRLAMSSAYFISILPLVLYATHPTELWENENTDKSPSGEDKEGTNGTSGTL